jgi:hypothetical protein
MFPFRSHHFQFLVPVNNQATIKTVKSKLSLATGIPSRSLVAFEVKGHRFERELHDDDRTSPSSYFSEKVSTLRLTFFII